MAKSFSDRGDFCSVMEFDDSSRTSWSDATGSSVSVRWCSSWGGSSIFPSLELVHTVYRNLDLEPTDTKPNPLENCLGRPLVNGLISPISPKLNFTVFALPLTAVSFPAGRNELSLHLQLAGLDGILCGLTLLDGWSKFLVSDSTTDFGGMSLRPSRYSL